MSIEKKKHTDDKLTGGLTKLDMDSSPGKKRPWQMLLEAPNNLRIDSFPDPLVILEPPARPGKSGES